MNKKLLISFNVPGDPRGKGRARSVALRNGDGTLKIKKTRTGKDAAEIRHHTDSKTRAYENQVQWLAMEAMKARPVTRLPVVVDITIRVPVPDSWAKWKREAAFLDRIMPTVKPDDDNVVKAIKDGLNKVAYHDDEQSVALNVIKVYALVPGVGVDVYEVMAAPAQIKNEKQFRALQARFLES